MPKHLTEEDASRSYPGYDDEIFPYLPTIYHRHNLLIRLSLFLSIAVCVICLTLNLLIWPQRWWSLFVLAGVGAGWATVAQAIRKRSSFCKHVLYQVVTVGIVVVLFDLMTGFGHWSFNYVIPALCVFAMMVIAIIAAMGHLQYLQLHHLHGGVGGLWADPAAVFAAALDHHPLANCSVCCCQRHLSCRSWLVRRSGTPGRSCTSVCTCKKNRTAPKWAQSGFFSSDYRVIQ